MRLDALASVPCWEYHVLFIFMINYFLYPFTKLRSVQLDGSVDMNRKMIVAWSAGKKQPTAQSTRLLLFIENKDQIGIQCRVVWRVAHLACAPSQGARERITGRHA